MVPVQWHRAQRRQQTHLRTTGDPTPGGTSTMRPRSIAGSNTSRPIATIAASCTNPLWGPLPCLDSVDVI
jgi:hypothetical protein